ncbi:site-2 protease family protein [Candidatus Uhrbacteria bacterium]|nr:site-2 protease family protein [Candidatus Uhrbacteria bacterium]
MLISVLAFVLVLSLLVFVHEAGHFFAARRAGMGVEEFGFGFPPRLVGVQRVRGRWRWVVGNRDHAPTGQSTIYSLNAVPLGGFVRITGEDGGGAENPRSFSAKSYTRRALVLVAGVGMNVLLSIVLFTIVFAIGAPQVLDGIPPGTVVRDHRVAIAGVLAESPAARAGVQPGDVVTAIGNQSVTTAAALQEYVRAHGGESVELHILRGTQAQVIVVQPEVLPGTGKTGVGVQLVETGIVRYPVHRAVVEGVRMTGYVFQEIIRSFAGLFQGLIRDRTVSVDVTGPVGIAVLTGQVVQLGFIHLLQFAGVLSANLALLNVVPFPALDGGRLALLLLEAIRRKSLRQTVERAIHTAGFLVLLVLIMLVTYRDLRQFGGGILAAMRTAVGF